ncbi:hypothetical protein E0E54_19910 [Azotobacter chroococcum]|uniref:condensation domain-containing protein n=1 Tax=Azotobacter chroococcum TaxID=353 RepID=UPI001040D0E2|nr:condensation domain-containing protein [Azotobacter chroococcum]TBW32143.1 hypothetical protein E0E54_19910 [Azotobacter chroococcum]
MTARSSRSFPPPPGSAWQLSQRDVPLEPIPDDVHGAVPLLPLQARLLERQGAAPCSQYLLFELDEDLEPILLEQALRALVAHHDALRLRFAEEGGAWRQACAEAGERHELLWLCEASGEAEVATLCTELQRSLDPRSGPLLRALCLSQAGRADRLLLAIHQLVADAISWRVLLEDLLRAYGQLVAGRRVALPAGTSSFKAWAERLEAWAATPALQAQRDFWLAQERACTQLPLLVREPAREEQRQCLELCLCAEFSRELLQAARQAYRLRADELLLAALSRVLCAWSEQDSIGLHLENHGRAPLFDGLDLGRTVGCFTSRYPLRLQPAADLPGNLRAIRAQLHSVVDGGLAYGLLRRRGELAGAAPQVLFRYLEPFGEVRDGPLRLVDAGRWREADALLEAPLCIEVEQRGGALRLRLDFSPSQWQRSTLEGLLQRLQDELRGIRAHCLHASRSRLAGAAPPAAPAHACSLPEPVRRHPEPIALARGDTRLAQVVLETRSNRLARHLIECGVGPGMRVGLCLAHGMAMIEGLLAILKAGGAFVPLDPDCPREQLACMAEDSGLQWLLTSTALCGRVPLGEEVEAICLDLLDASGYSSEPPSLALRPRDPACLLYAAGPPGRPRAVTIGHADLSRHMQDLGRSYGMRSAEAELPGASTGGDGALERWAAELSAQMLRGLCRRRVDFFAAFLNFFRPHPSLPA